MSMLRTA